MKRQTFVQSVLREDWDYETRRYTTYDDKGVLINWWPFTAEENAEADAHVARAAEEQADEQNRREIGSAQLLDNLRTIAEGTGQFATAAQRDAAIRVCARALLALIRLTVKRGI